MSYPGFSKQRTFELYLLLQVGASSEDDKVKQLKSSILNQYGQVEVEVDDLDPTGESVISEICFALL